MGTRILKNKPLVEAILEVKWQLQPVKPDGAIDPHFRLLVGRLYDRILGEYPYHEELPSAGIPDEITAHVVKHRFRTAENNWPVVQVGPGILTLNDTHKYTWDDFHARAERLVGTLFDAHPRSEELHISNLLLRYIDAVDLDYRSENALEFLREKLQVSVELPKDLFEDRDTDPRPHHLSWHSTFRCENPNGVVHMKISTGQRDKSPAILWETMVQSVGNHVPSMPGEFAGWIAGAHEVTNHWFFTLIEGDLERRFSGD